MAPYVPLLIPELQQALIDPLPEVRATAAKAMGSLLRGMGEHHSQDLMPWLLETLKSEVKKNPTNFPHPLSSPSTLHSCKQPSCPYFLPPKS